MSGKSIGFDKTMVNIHGTFDRRVHAAYALCRKYAELSKQTLQGSQGLEQGEGQFWANRTSAAVKSVKGYAVADYEDIGWGLAHTMDYGVWLELAHNRKNAALEPTVKVLLPFFMDDLRKIYA